jgi:hypothetical protein
MTACLQRGAPLTTKEVDKLAKLGKVGPRFRRPVLILTGRRDDTVAPRLTPQEKNGQSGQSGALFSPPCATPDPEREMTS